MILQHANVCLPSTAFQWNGLQLPGADADQADSITEGGVIDGSDGEDGGS
ncbi:MAG: hypothetical protein M5U19_15420 [Microthrixaceae bacterium]|nr:hypothetical protein [Microthrixaceae bacterium]